jgi:5-methylcytosine-specific restriction endonuclease McrA
MTGSRRVQCGAVECRRKWNAERARVDMARRRAADPGYGRRYETRPCPSCGVSRKVRIEKDPKRCQDCQRRAALVLALEAWLALPKLPAEEVRRRKRARERRRRKRARLVAGRGFAYVPLPADLREARRRSRQADKRHRRRARARAAFVETVRRAEIFARDEYRCLLCGGALAMAECVPHPLAPTIDHVLPLARGGAHAPWNVQAAHFLCNSRKRDNVLAFCSGERTPTCQ